MDKKKIVNNILKDIIKYPRKELILYCGDYSTNSMYKTSLYIEKDVKLVQLKAQVKHLINIVGKDLYTY